MPDATDPTPVPSRFGEYVVEHEIGRGGMGIVYLARDPRLDRRVAIKILPPELAADPDRLTRLRREARALAALNHPNIATIYGMEEDPRHGRFIVMEWVEGRTLADRLESGPLPPAEALTVVREVAEALSSAHAQGVVHRDIKPRNLVLSSTGRVKVLDFGLARRGESAAWEEPAAQGANEHCASMTDGSGAMMGTASYMSPERILGDREDRRTDIFSFGCVLYECLTGRRAFAGATRFGALAATLGARPDLDALDPALPPLLRELIRACLQRRPEKRPASMGDILAVIALAAPDLTPERPERAGAEVPNNLPSERTSFIGRRKDLADCARLLTESRLLTVTGIGGSGKTRLALRLARQSLDAFAGGVWFVDLASLKDAERVTLTVATALDMREEQGAPLVESLIRRLRDEQALIVLDNCEHVIEAVAALVDALLSATLHLKLLATSREGLGVDGERIYSLRSLTTPPRTVEDLARIEEAEAVQLFVQRSRFVDPHFEMSTRTAPAVAEICRRLDGIPFAVELAAVRVKLFTVEEIRDRLDDRFRLLTGGSKTALPRHQTLQATLQWSEDPLPPNERLMFHRLSVFAGGWTLEAATKVANAGNDLDALATLERLVDKSLVVAERGPDRSTRYSMLETVRQYAQERLNETTEREATRTRHLNFYVDLAEEAPPNLVGPELAAWLLRLQPEQENLLSAHAWCDHDAEGAEKGLRLTTALLRYWTSQGLLELGSRVARQALDRREAGARTKHRASALYSTGILAYARGLYPEVAACWNESVAISREIGDRAAAARSTMGLGTLALVQGERAAAQAHLEEAIAVAREAGANQVLGAALNGLAELHRAQGDLARAAVLYEEALALFREQGSFNVAVILLNLAIVAIEQGDLKLARGRLAEVARLAEEDDARFAGWGVLEVTASLASASSRWARAARVWGSSEAARARLGRTLAPNDEHFMKPWIEKAREALGQPDFDAELSAGRALSYEEALSEARIWLQVGEPDARA